MAITEVSHLIDRFTVYYPVFIVIVLHVLSGFSDGRSQIKVTVA